MTAPEVPPTPPENPYRRVAYELLAALSQASLVNTLGGDEDAYREAVTNRLDRARVQLGELDARRDADRAALAEAFARHRSGRPRAEAAARRADETPTERPTEPTEETTGE